MQTFLPYPDFAESARALDWRRLGKQRAEALTILNIIEGRTTSRGWQNHPAVNMWRGYARALRVYLNECIREWVRRGYVNNMPVEEVPPESVEYPWWLGVELFHASHRANLLRKDPEFYSGYGWDEDPRMPYWWPTEHE